MNTVFSDEHLDHAPSVDETRKICIDENWSLEERRLRMGAESIEQLHDVVVSHSNKKSDPAIPESASHDSSAADLNLKHMEGEAFRRHNGELLAQMIHERYRSNDARLDAEIRELTRAICRPTGMAPPSGDFEIRSAFPEKDVSDVIFVGCGIAERKNETALDLRKITTVWR